NQKLPAPYRDEGREAPVYCWRATNERWQLPCTLFPTRNTRRCQGTDGALWLSRRTNQRAEFHQCLIESGNVIRGPFTCLPAVAVTDCGGLARQITSQRP